MFFDDRLETVLRQRADGDVGKRTQFRQLLDLLGSHSTGSEDRSRDPSLLAAAWLRMDALGQAIPAEKRAQMVREPGWRFRNPQLAAHLAEFEPEVAAAALSRAQLTQEDWSALIPRLPVRARGFLRLRRDLPVDVEALLDRLGVHDRGLPAPTTEQAEEQVDPQAAADPADMPPPHDFGPERPVAADPEPSPSPALPAVPLPANDPEPEESAAGRSEISALVERIAQFRRSREASGVNVSEDGGPMPRLPLGEDDQGKMREVAGFGFSADTSGRIEWADSEVAAMVIGTRLVRPTRAGLIEEMQDSVIERGFSRRQPLSGATLTLDGAPAIAGEWVIDAQPRFTDSGHFIGYVGRFRRPFSADANAPSPAQREADRIRQLLHELRTPVTAVQGYAEVIQQQLFGTAPHEYRALAAAIAADAARILAGFEEMDRLARLETGGLTVAPGATDLAAGAQRTINQLAQVLTPRLSGIEIERTPEEPLDIAIAEAEAETLLWRLLATLGGGCAAGEMLGAQIFAEGENAVLTCEIPASLLSEEDIFAAEARPIGSAINAGLFGAGFALRLVRAEVRAAGGNLLRDGEQLILTLPQVLALTEQADPDLDLPARPAG